MNMPASGKSQRALSGVIRDSTAEPPASAESISIPVGPSAEEADVQVIRQNGQIQAIDVTCTCGRRTRILCEYE